MTSVLSVVGKYTIKTAIVVLLWAVFYKVLRESTKTSPLFQSFSHISASLLGGTSETLGDTNFNDLTTVGMYFISGTITNGPAELVGSVCLAIVLKIGGRPFQICISQHYNDAGKFWGRTHIDKWYDWRASN